MNRFFSPLDQVDLPDINAIKNVSDIDKKQFKKSKAYKKYVLPAKKREKDIKKANRINWWKNNWIAITTLIIAIITLATTIIFGLLQLQN